LLEIKTAVVYGGGGFLGGALTRTSADDTSGTFSG
jgi:hypothetical protein